MLRKLVEGSKNYGVNPNITCHSFRRSFATMYYRNGTGIKELKELMGHESIKTTEKYILLAEEDLAKILTPLDIIEKRKKRKGKSETQTT